MSPAALTTASVSFKDGRQQVRLGGYLRDLPRPSAAEVVTDRTVEKLPQVIDLRPHCTEVEDQKTLGSCTANAAVGALEYHRKRHGIDPSDLSRLFVYYNTRRLKGCVDEDSGATIAESMAAVMAYGAPRADLWPYDDKERWREQPPQEVYDNASLNEVVQYARVSTGAGVLGAVAAGFPVCFGIFMPASAYDIAGATGEVPELSDADWASPSAGGHAMLIVGYDLLRRLYLVRNSWGPGYGDGGYIRIPFSVMDRGAPAEGFWVLGQLEQSGGVTLRNTDGPSEIDRLRDRLRSDIEGGLADVRQGLRDRLTKK
ncbi:MAG: C1 family peptidase [Neomegalonema sp.]|nr:C1 family peptidase [Neomegalonema sp.]